jgi:hypothetical protein
MVTVMVEVAVPSAVTDEREAETVDNAGDTVPGLKITLAVGVIEMLSVTSIALKKIVFTLVELTVKAATPEALVVEGEPVMDTPVAGAAVNVTDLPATPFEFASLRVTVIVEVEVPSAIEVDGEEVTVEIAGETTPGVKVTVVVGVIEIESVVSTALKATAADLVDLTVNIALPPTLVVAGLPPIVTPVEGVALKVTFLLETALPLASLRVTVTVEVVVPSATTVGGDETIVVTVGDTAVGTKTAVGVEVRVTASVASIAVKV